MARLTFYTLDNLKVAIEDGVSVTGDAGAFAVPDTYMPPDYPPPIV